MPSNDSHESSSYHSFHSSRLETPPPTSQLRRSWSPQESTAHSGAHFVYPEGGNSARREPSDSSVEALDLAEYSATLRRSDLPSSSFQSPYPPFPPNSYSSYHATPSSYYPDIPTPTLTSPGAASVQSHTSYPLTPPTHRPFSVGPPSIGHNYRVSDPQYSSPLSYPRALTRSPDPFNVEDDIAAIPNWQQLYSEKNPVPPRSSFDHYSVYPDYYQPYRAPVNFSHPAHNTSWDGSPRDPSLPWSSEPNHVQTVPPMQEERMKMLDQEPQRSSMDISTTNTKNRPPILIGCVDKNGKLITDGPKKRLINRLLQAALAVGAVVISFYSAVLIKPTTPPPPQGTVPTYSFYSLSVLMLLAMFITFVIMPFCCGSRPGKMTPQGAAGMMVFPVQGGAPGTKGNKNTKGRKNNQQPVQVNLIVDPSMFGRMENGQVGQHPDAISTATQGNMPGRKNLLQGLKEEEQWRIARHALQRLLYFDIGVAIVWVAQVILMLRGKSCPDSQFDGWCENYHVAIAIGCAFVLSFGVNIFFDIKDLHASKISPRSRPG